MRVPSIPPAPNGGGLKPSMIVAFTFAVIGPVLGAVFALLESWVMPGLSHDGHSWRHPIGFIVVYAAVGFFVPGVVVGAVLAIVAGVRASISFFETLGLGGVVHVSWICVYTLPSGSLEVFLSTLTIVLPVALLATGMCWLLTKDILAP